MSACAGLPTASKADPPECDFPQGLTDWNPLPDTLFQSAPTPDKVPAGTTTDTLYTIIREARDATDKYNRETIPNIQAAAETQDEKVDEYNKSLTQKDEACKATIKKWIEDREDYGRRRFLFF